MFDSDRRLVLVTAHRRENWGDGLRGIGEAIARLAAAHPDVAFVLPLHPNPRVRSSLRPLLGSLANVLLCEPVSYGEFARLLARCHLVITDSGGIQEEAPALGKPVLVTREITERVEGIDAGTLELVGHGHRADLRFGTPAADRPGGLRRDVGVARTRTATASRRRGSSRRSTTCSLGGTAPAPFGSSLDRRAVLAATAAVEANVIALPQDMPDPEPEPAVWDVREAS